MTPEAETGVNVAAGCRRRGRALSRTLQRECSLDFGLLVSGTAREALLYCCIAVSH